MRETKGNKNIDFDEMYFSWGMSHYGKKLRKLRNYQKCFSWPPLSGYVAKSWLLSQFNEKEIKNDKWVHKTAYWDRTMRNWELMCTLKNLFRLYLSPATFMNGPVSQQFFKDFLRVSTRSQYWQLAVKFLVKFFS